MGKVLRVLRNGTRNQSTADFSRSNVFIFGNRYTRASILNGSGDDVVFEDGILVMRSATDTTKIVPVLLTADLAKTIGVLKTDEVEVADGASVSVHFAHKGELDGNLLVLPEASTLNTLVGDRTLKDVLTGLGFIVSNVAEDSKFDN
ncbi:structural protein [Cellulophaga phage phi47:1]|uniref:head decoration n=1 Tax=Cellulophaga phage phiSM TaxID=756280 RepID=UPI0002B79670|nr:head decoration [Cellulophaga phage phiSM]AGF91654.1 hypothetical protein CDPG_00050 [Cellulophaga phage phi47:1]AGO47747.1 structural protein [Cellulophaga phage phi3ST:2]AGO49255.1 structural protein [Cellulophaga phage phi38:2]AGO49335.1 structural protein [Cellulophaga phage phi3:1]AGH07763.1 hypothetical protein CEPG_00015 [Cellulophaga phage phiSM]